MLWVLIKLSREAILMSTHNIGFSEDLTKFFFNYHQISSNTHLISFSACTLHFSKIFMPPSADQIVNCVDSYQGLLKQSDLGLH